MTTIAANHECMAGDSLVTHDNVTYETTKVFRIREDIVGICGGLADGARFLEWYENGCKDDVSIDSEEFSALVLRWGADGEPELVLYNGAHKRGDVIKNRPNYAIGAGQLGAIVAMHLGKSPRSAVKAVAAVSPSTGGEIDVLRLRRAR